MEDKFKSLPISPQGTLSESSSEQSIITTTAIELPGWRKRKIIISVIVGAIFLLIALIVPITISIDEKVEHQRERGEMSITNRTANETTSTTSSPTLGPTLQPGHTAAPTSWDGTYVPGNLTRQELGLLLSEGLRARIIARSGELVEYSNGSFSDILFHGRPDFGATFVDTRPFNKGGWVYASNSEMEEKGAGGVGSLTFDKDGEVIDYRMVLEKTTMNCGGGKTPW